MLNIQSFKDKLSLDGIIEDIPDDFLVFKRDSLFARKPFEKLNNYSGSHNVIVGPNAGQHIKRASHNVMLGSGAGYHTFNKDINKKYLSSYNVFLGKDAGYSNVDGYYNTYIGYGNSKIATNDRKHNVESEIRHNIGIGSKSSSTGGRSISLGDDSFNIGKYTTIIGHENSNQSTNSLIIGEKIINTGNNSFILRANGTSRSITQISGLSNIEDNYVNINDMFIGTTEDLGVYVPVTFHEDVSFSNDIITGNLRVRDQFISENQAFMNNVLMSNLTVTDTTILSNNVIITRDPQNITNATFNVEIEATFSGLSRFVNKTIKSDDLFLDYRNESLLDQNKNFSIRFTDDIDVDLYIDKEQFITRLPVVFENNVNFRSNLRVVGEAELIGDRTNITNLFIDDVSIYDLLSSSNTASNVLQEFNWLRSNQDDVLLSGFSNDIAPWLRVDPSEISLSIFDQTNLLPEWVKPLQNEVDLGYFKNDHLAPWLRVDQSNVNLSQFSNDLSPWLQYDQSDIDLDNFRFNDIYIWLKFPGHFSQNNYDLSSFNNNFLNIQSESTFQANVNFLGGLHSFGDLLDVHSTNSIFRSNVTFRDNIDVLGNSSFESNVEINGILRIKDLVAINNDNQKIIEIDDEKVHIEGDLIVSHANSNVFSVIDSNITFGGSGGEINYEDLVVFKYGAYFMNENKIISGGSLEFEENSELILNGGFSLKRNNSNLIYIEESENKITFENTEFLIKDKDNNIFQVENSNISIEGDGNFTVNTESLLKDKLYIYAIDSNNDNWWSIFSKAPRENENTSNGANLFFHSKKGATIRFDDKFEESILNFTGQHRCSLSHLNNHIFRTKDDKNKNVIDEYIGKIVCATGKYEDLSNKEIININESIPVVELCNEIKDKRVFGVISGIEEYGEEREFKVGNLSFVISKEEHTKKLMINSVGEGGIWVCNINGSFKNGDYITSSSIEGYGMLQDDNIQYNYTVGKITCDCSFKLDSSLYNCVQFKYRGIVYKKAFVGCTYTC